jgi:8-oxo-dGTP diphosphatase
MNRRDVALLILVRDDGCLLLQHRTEDAPLWPGYWGLFGGGIDGNETPKQAIEREIFEELHYPLPEIRLFLVMDIDRQDYAGTRYIFLASYDNKTKLEMGEGQGMGWFNIDEALSLKLNEYNRRTIELYRDTITYRL